MLSLLLELFGILKVCVGGNYVYEKIFGSDEVVVGKGNAQKIECTYLSLRAWVKRWARRTTCFSRFLQMRKAVVDLCINVNFFKRPIAI